jgi:hypothetical protein
MSKIKQNQAGFGTVEIIVVIVVVALAGFAGWMVHKNHHKPAKAAPVAVAATPSPAATNPYTGWKSYCDTINNGCFKYPNNWTLTSSNANGLVNVQVSSPGQTATAVYKTIPAAIVTPQSGAAFYAASTNNVSSSNPALKVVGGYFTSGNIPYFYLVEASSLSTYPLTASQASQFETIPDYTITNSSANFGSFYAYNSQKGYSPSAARAQSWYSTSDGQNSLLIVQSFSYQ